jgi:hypothetical protein
MRRMTTTVQVSAGFMFGRGERTGPAYWRGLFGVCERINYVRRGRAALLAIGSLGTGLP